MWEKVHSRVGEARIWREVRSRKVSALTNSLTDGCTREREENGLHKADCTKLTARS